MAEVGKSHLVIMWTVEPDNVAEGDRIFESHGKWMAGHARQGPTALLSYSISKGPEMSDPMNPDSPPTGNTIFVLSEFYESPAGIAEHWRLAASSDPSEGWADFGATLEWGARAAKVCTLHNGTAVQALW